MNKPSIDKPGLYESVNGIYVVRPTRDRQRLYADQLLSADRSGIVKEYCPGAVYNLYPEDQMSRERAIELMRLCRRCLVCHRKLKDLNSIERGMGPVCGKYLK